MQEAQHNMNIDQALKNNQINLFLMISRFNIKKENVLMIGFLGQHIPILRSCHFKESRKQKKK